MVFTLFSLFIDQSSSHRGKPGGDEGCATGMSSQVVIAPPGQARWWRSSDCSQADGSVGSDGSVDSLSLEGSAAGGSGGGVCSSFKALLSTSSCATFATEAILSPSFKFMIRTPCA